MNLRNLLFAAALATAAASPAVAADAGATTLVPVSGTVLGGNEAVLFSGQAAIHSRLAADPDFGRPKVVLTLDLTALAGRGALSQAKYVIPATDIVQRSLVATDVVTLTFPFLPQGSASAGARAGLATFELTFDLKTGAVTAASVALGTPAF